MIILENFHMIHLIYSIKIFTGAALSHMLMAWPQLVIEITADNCSLLHEHRLACRVCVPVACLMRIGLHYRLCSWIFLTADIYSMKNTLNGAHCHAPLDL